MTRRLLALAAAGLVAAGVTAGCAVSGLDAAKVGDAIKAEPPDDVVFSEVSCPPGIEAKAGTTFECVATAGDGVKVIVTVTQTDDAGGVTFAFDGTVVATAEVADMLDADVEAVMDADVELTCPRNVALADRSGAFRCDGVDEGGDRFQIEVTVADGSVAPDGWSFVDAG